MDDDDFFDNLSDLWGDFPRVAWWIVIVVSIGGIVLFCATR